MFNVLIIRKQWPNSKNEKTEWNADSKGVEVAGGGGGGGGGGEEVIYPLLLALVFSSLLLGSSFPIITY